MVVLAVTWAARPGHEDEVAAVFRKLEAASRRDPGCLMFVAHQHGDDASRFLIYEQYEHDAALQVHRSSPHFHEYVRKVLPGIAERLQGDFYIPLTSV
jgi:quinol monooxygenase YgiN